MTAPSAALALLIYLMPVGDDGVDVPIYRPILLNPELLFWNSAATSTIHTPLVRLKLAKVDQLVLLARDTSEKSSLYPEVEGISEASAFADN